MATYRRNEIVSGLFIVGAVGVFMLFAFRVGNLNAFGLLRGRAFACEAYFSDVKSLDAGAKVTVAGQRVGSVRSLAIAERPIETADIQRLRDAFGPGAFRGLEQGMLQARVRVEFDLDDPTLRFDPESARVSLVQDGFLGRHHLAFYPGHWSDDRPPARIFDMPSGIQEVAVTETPDLDQLIASVNPAVRRVDSLLESLQNDILDRGGVTAARQALDNLATTLRELAALFDSADPKGVHALVLRPLHDLIAQVDGSVQQIEDRLIAPAESMLQQGPVLVEDARSVLSSARGILDENRPRVASVLSQLDDATRDLDSQLAGIHREAESLLESVRGTVQDNSPEIAEIARRLRRAMWQAEMALRKIRANPAFLLFGDEETDLEARARDFSDTWRSGRARSYKQRDEGDGK